MCTRALARLAVHKRNVFAANRLLLHPLRLQDPTTTCSTAHSRGPATPPRAKQSAVSLASIVAAVGITVAGALVYAQLANPPQLDSEQPSQQQSPVLDDDGLLVGLFGMPATIAPGRPGNLTAEQEAKLREMWKLLHKIIGVTPAQEFEQVAIESDGTKPLSRVSTGTDSPLSQDKKKKNRFSVFRKDKDKKREGESSPSPAPTSASGTVNDILSSVDENDKHGQTKQFKEAMAQMTPEEIRTAMWEMTKHDNPDGLLLRFLRARKWDIQAALVMLISAMRWRLLEAKVDSDVMLHGEEGMTRAGSGAEDAPVSKQDGQDFMAQMRLGKSFLRGVDKQGRPMCIVRVRLHRQGEQTEPSLERYTVYTIETARMFLKPPVDTATLVFDMTDFSLANMDYTPVKFMIKCFEANYPESLGAVLVHRAPWLFSSVWKIIKGWLDPVVASKIHFTNNLEDLSQFIDRDQVIKELGGPVDFEYSYTEPADDENKCMADTATRDRLQQERAAIVRQFEQKTLAWVIAHERPSDASHEHRARISRERQEIARDLRENYWELDPYLRARSLYDRTGLLKDFVGHPAEDDDSEGFHTAPATPLKVSVEVRRSLEVRTKVNGTAASSDVD